MFIRREEIDHLKTVEEGTMKAMIGVDVEYYFLTHGGHGVCGVPAVFVAARQGNGKEDAFYIDLAIATPVVGFYTYHQNLPVLSLILEALDDTTSVRPAFAKHDEIDEIIRLVNDRNNPVGNHLRLVPQ